MTKKIACELINRFITGWIENDIKKICSCLLENCIIVEPHGATYYGIHDVENWFHSWTIAKNKITKWDILSYYYCDDERTVFFESDFTSVSHNGAEFSILAFSVVKFYGTKISSIHEYRMTNPKYSWRENKSKSSIY